MKKVAAFITAFVLFFGIIVALHLAVTDNVSVKNKDFGTWVSVYKDLSYTSISENISRDSMLVFGSSEFNHGKRTLYHPANLFKNKKADIMIIGKAYNQSLSHAISLGAVEGKLQNRKVILILSPTWFYKEGVIAKNYAIRFSEGNYMALMENKDISKDVKRRIGQRTIELLKSDDMMRSRVKRYNRMYLDDKGSYIDRMLYGIRKKYLRDKELLTVNTAFKLEKLKETTQQKKNPEYGVLDWKALSKKAVESEIKGRTNPYGMSDRFFHSKFKKRLVYAENYHAKASFEKSPEYDDLKCFLDICRQTDIKSMLVIQPLNGHWYDYTGLTEEKRRVFNDNIKKIASEYDAEVTDLSYMEYSKYYFEDAVHPARRGWVTINEEIYRFYNEDNNSNR
ncbi:MAG: D-alanyl-lipoteichoic acid biosynthesis protein DltD [Clostridiales bacterium]|nr:D-alanyl-lipoteichoic acid biosynthesis protein DltD [Clostridiales bacterium]